MFVLCTEPNYTQDTSVGTATSAYPQLQRFNKIGHVPTTTQVHSIVLLYDYRVVYDVYRVVSRVPVLRVLGKIPFGILKVLTPPSYPLLIKLNPCLRMNGYVSNTFPGRSVPSRALICLFGKPPVPASSIELDNHGSGTHCCWNAGGGFS